MITERYIINFYSVGDKKFGESTVMDLWKNAAKYEFERHGVFVNAVIESMLLICNMPEGCAENNRGIRIISTRNPILNESKEEFFRVIQKVILDVKQKLGNPYVSISILDTNYFFFDSV